MGNAMKSEKKERKKQKCEFDSNKWSIKCNLKSCFTDTKDYIINNNKALYQYGT